jgi:hypothetical protein
LRTALVADSAEGRFGMGRRSSSISPARSRTSFVKVAIWRLSFPMSLRAGTLRTWRTVVIGALITFPAKALTRRPNMATSR